ncbi:MAG: dehydrogenase, partial [Planctomycetota bacterium]
WKIDSIVSHKHQKAAYCGIHYFDSDAYPAAYRDKLYMGNVHGGCINVDSVRRDGSTYRGEGHPDFLTANDAWFMPVVQKTGPDGCLYILDWYDRYHCYQDANRDPQGIDRLKGRLYRVRYGESPRAPKIDLGRETDEQLIDRLRSPNVFHRDTAQRLLAERASLAATPRLEAMALNAEIDRKHRLHALWVSPGQVRCGRNSTPGCSTMPTRPSALGVCDWLAIKLFSVNPPLTRRRLAGRAKTGPRRMGRRDSTPLLSVVL